MAANGAAATAAAPARAEHWESVYEGAAARGEKHEWMCGWEQLAPHLLSLCSGGAQPGQPKASKVLVVGCGTSEVSEKL